jgi:SOS response regulatory protein OraA/RecX
MFFNGQGVLQDSVYAHMWINIASANGYKTGAKSRDIISKQMTPSQIEKAQELARQCIKKEYKDC